MTGSAIGFSKLQALAKISAGKLPFSLWAHRETKEVVGATGFTVEDEAREAALSIMYGGMDWRNNDDGCWIRLTDERGRIIEAARPLLEEIAQIRGVEANPNGLLKIAHNRGKLEHITSVANGQSFFSPEQPGFDAGPV